jgi:predicted Zn-dependent protease
MILVGYCAVGWTAEITPLAPEEAEVRAIMELALEDQRLIEKSGILYRNEALESYLNLVAARLDSKAASPGGGFRVKMIKDPHLNAFTYPDGTCYIQTGILARIENEAELAALLAHELAHYTSSHAVNGIRRLHRHSGNDLSSPALNREENISRTQIRRRIECAWSGYHHEADFEADREGLKFMIRAGYDPYAVLRLLGHLAEEMSTENLQEPLRLGSHPRLKARIEKCNEFLANMNPEHPNSSIKEGNFEENIQDLLLKNIGLDIQAGRFAQALQASNRYLSVRSDDARGHYLLGEIYRQQGRGGTEVTRAESCYKRAIDLDDEYAEPHRALGMLYYKTGLSQQARPYLEASLALAPKAPENAYIRNYLSRIQP